MASATSDSLVPPPFLTYTDAVTLWVDDLRCEVRHVGGAAHTTNDSIPERRILFAGDLLFRGGTPFLVLGAVAGSIRVCEQVPAPLGVTTIVPGHGGIAGPELIDDVLGYLRFVTDVAARGHAAGLSPLDCARETDLGRYAGWLDPERIVGDLHRAYPEIDGATPGARIDVPAAVCRGWRPRGASRPTPRPPRTAPGAGTPRIRPGRRTRRRRRDPATRIHPPEETAVRHADLPLQFRGRQPGEVQGEVQGEAAAGLTDVRGPGVGEPERPGRLRRTRPVGRRSRATASPAGVVTVRSPSCIDSCSSSGLTCTPSLPPARPPPVPARVAWTRFSGTGQAGSTSTAGGEPGDPRFVVGVEIHDPVAAFRGTLRRAAGTRRTRCRRACRAAHRVPRNAQARASWGCRATRPQQGAFRGTGQY